MDDEERSSKLGGALSQCADEARSRPAPESIPQLTDAPAARDADRPAVRCTAGGDQRFARGIEVVNVEVHDVPPCGFLVGEVEEQLELAELHRPAL